MKYELIDDPSGLKRLRALRNIPRFIVKVGELGGLIEADKNLSQESDAWVSGNARVYGDAQVSGNARVSGNAWVSGDAQVSGDAWVYGVTRSDNYSFCYLPCADGQMRVIAGCRYFTMAEAREHWASTRGGTPLGHETTAILDYLERMAAIRGYA